MLKIICVVFLCIVITTLAFKVNDFELISSYRPDSCRASKFASSFGKTLRSLDCTIPRETLVTLESKINGFQYMRPNAIFVRRCSSVHCFGSEIICSPEETKDKHIAVRTGIGYSQCSWITVKEHTKCKCECAVKESDCNENQRFSAASCKCKCSNYDDKRDCLQQDNMEWDEKTCSCSCQVDLMECSTGTEWIPSKCMCDRIMMSNEVPPVFM